MIPKGVKRHLQENIRDRCAVHKSRHECLHNNISIWWQYNFTWAMHGINSKGQKIASQNVLDASTSSWFRMIWVTMMDQTVIRRPRLLLYFLFNLFYAWNRLLHPCVLLLGNTPIYNNSECRHLYLMFCRLCRQSINLRCLGPPLHDLGYKNVKKSYMIYYISFFMYWNVTS